MPVAYIDWDDSHVQAVYDDASVMLIPNKKGKKMIKRWLKNLK